MDLSSEQKDAIVAAHKSLLEQLSSIYVINQALPDALMGRTSISTVSSAAPPTLVRNTCRAHSIPCPCYCQEMNTILISVVSSLFNCIQLADLKHWEHILYEFFPYRHSVHVSMDSTRTFSQEMSSCLLGTCSVGIGIKLLI